MIRWGFFLFIFFCSCNSEIEVEVFESFYISSPRSGSFINENNQSNLKIIGICPKNGEQIFLSLDEDSPSLCNQGKFSFSSNFETYSDGKINIKVSRISSKEEKLFSEKNYSLIKDTSKPNLSIENNINNKVYSFSDSTLISGKCFNNNKMMKFYIA